MKSLLLTGVAIIELAYSVAGQTAPGTTADSARLPEIEVLRAPYLKNLTAIRTARDTRTAPITRSYLAALDRLEKEISARGDLDGALAVKAERERAAGKEELTAEERKKMSPSLSALRERYDKDLAPIETPALQQEQQLTRQYLVALDALQRRLTTVNQIEKAAHVRAERESAAASLPDKATVGREAKTAAASTVRAEGKLDPALADKVAAAIGTKSYVRTENSSDSGKTEGGADIPAEGALLVGFEFMERPGKNQPWIRSLRPYFMTREAVVAGKDRGKMEDVSDKILVRSGYAVAGLESCANIQVIFMKIDPVTGRFDTSPVNTYKSKWYGTKVSGTPKQLGGDGRFVIGVYGKTGANCDSLGLVQMP
jgi:hypothetical protein